MSKECNIAILNLGESLGKHRQKMADWQKDNYAFINKALSAGGKERKSLDRKWQDQVIGPLKMEVWPKAAKVNKQCKLHISEPELGLFESRFVDDPEDDIDNFIKEIFREL